MLNHWKLESLGLSIYIHLQAHSIERTFIEKLFHLKAYSFERAFFLLQIHL